MIGYNVKLTRDNLRCKANNKGQSITVPFKLMPIVGLAPCLIDITPCLEPPSPFRCGLISVYSIKKMLQRAISTAV